MLTHIRDHSSDADVPNGYVGLTSAQKLQITDAIGKIAGPVESPSPSPTASPSTSPTASPSTSPTASPSASPTATATVSPTSSPVATVPAVIDPGNTDSGGSGSGVDGGTGGLVDGGVINQIVTKLPSIFAVPFVPHNGAAAGILPALVLIGVSASAVGALNKVKEDKNGARE